MKKNNNNNNNNPDSLDEEMPGIIESLKSLSTRSKCTIAVIFIVALIMIFVADDYQQKRFYYLNSAYQQMQDEDYSGALNNFEKYAEKRSDIYWGMIDTLQGSDSYASHSSVMDAMEACQEALNLTP